MDDSIDKEFNPSCSLGINTYQKEFGFDSNIKLIYNGFTAISQQIYPYIYSGKINILFAGRFVPQKGIPVLINIIKRVDEKVFYFHIGR